MSRQLRTSFTGFLIAMICASIPIQCLAGTQAQDEPPDTKLKKNGLKLAVEAPEKIDAGDSFEFKLKLVIPDGFHIYGIRDQTMPTTVSVDEVEGITFAEPEIPAGVRHAKSGGGANYWLERRQTIRTKVTVNEAATGELKIAGKLAFMICDERACKPPAELPFEVVVMVGPIETKSRIADVTAVEFKKPIKLLADGKAVSVPSPGYAAPCLADVNGDGRKDLLVGQYAGGKIKVYSGLADGKFAKGEWLQADGKTAKVPGVW